MPRAFKVVVEKNLQISLRDGTATYADVYRPLDEGSVPAVVVRTPYDKEITMATVAAVLPYLKLAERGYAVVVQDCRGRGSSAGEFYPFANETNDGYDTVAWAAQQPWSNGSTALMGASYFGATTMLGARSNPPGLKAIMPMITTDDYYETWSYHGGAFQLGFLGPWSAGLVIGLSLRPDCQIPLEKQQHLNEYFTNTTKLLSHRPITTLPIVSDPEVAPWWRDWVAHTENDQYWRRWRVADSHGTITAAGLHIGGWFDIFLAGTIRNFVGLTQAGNAPQKMIIGPWTHNNYDRYLGALEFGLSGPANASGVAQDIVTWLDRHLLGKEDVETGPAVRYFLMSANRWEEAGAWPPSNATLQRWFLHSGGSANSLRGNGALSREVPTAEEPSDVYLYNPERPVPTTGGNLLMSGIHSAGPFDQHLVEARDDVLVYTSEPLGQDLKVAGPVRAYLWAATDGPDTDWTAKLVDVHPDGLAVGLCDGIIRARYREGTDTARLLSPGKPYDYTIDLVSTANLFKQGHRLRLEISSSNFPRFDRNGNTGGKVQEETSSRLALQHVHHTPSMPSSLELYVLPS